MSNTTGQPRNRRYIRVSQQRKTKLRWPENSIEHQNVHRRRSSSSSATNPRSMEEECEYGLPSGTCFTARRLEVVAVAGLLWIYFVVCFFSVRWDFRFFACFFFLRTHTAYCKYDATLPHVPLYSTGVRTGCQYLICLSVWVCVRVTFVVLTDCESCTRPIATNPGSMEWGEYGLTCGTCFIASRLELHAMAGLLWISWCVLGGADFSVIFFRFFFLRTHTACCKYEATLPHLPLY